MNETTSTPGVSARAKRASVGRKASCRDKTRAPQSNLDRYLMDLRHHPLLSAEEEHDIAVRFAKTGDQQLASRLITANLRLVVKIAFEYRMAHQNPLDLVQEGNIGLLDAVTKFDPHRGVKLSSYAAWWIRAYILRYVLSNARLVKVGTTQAQRRLFFGLRRERARLETSSGAPVDAKQLATAMNVREKDVVEMDLRMAAKDASLDAPVHYGGDDDRSFGELLRADGELRPDVQAEASDFRAILGGRLRIFCDSLVGRDIEIFRSRLLNDDAASLSEIATKFGVSRERVRQIEARLKGRLREYLQASMGDALPQRADADKRDHWSDAQPVGEA